MARGRKTALTITLTTDERQTLMAWQRSTKMPAVHARRGRMIMLLADGVSLSQIAKMVGTTRHLVSKWAKRFLQQRLDGLIDKPRRGRPSKAHAQRDGSDKAPHGP